MNTLNIPVNSSLLKLYSFYVDIINPLIKLTKQERSILSTMLLIHYQNKHNPDVNELILSKQTRKTIRNYLNISEASFNNSIQSLKEKECLKNNKLNKNLIIYPEDNKLMINYTINLIK